MEKNKAGRGALPMLQLSLPLVMEQFFRILVSSIDTVMLSFYSSQAVAAVGMMTQYVFFVNILFNVIAIGTSIVLSQYLGAQKGKDDLNSIAKASAVMVSSVAFVLMFAIIFGTKPLLSAYNLEPEVRAFATQYFTIFGGGSAFFIAFSLIQSAFLRSYGYTKEAMLVTFAANLLNVIGNAISLYGFFGLPVFGVKGVAVSSAFAMLVSCILLGIIIKKKKDICFDIFGIGKISSKFYKLILSVGIPTASENLSYNVSQIVIMAMISTLGTVAMSAQVYTTTICRFVFVIAIGIGSAVQIKAGYYVGAHQGEFVYKKVFRYSAVATACSMAVILLINLFKGPIVGFFTSDVETASLVSSLLLFSIYLEFGRSLNLIYIGALKGAGDIRFPVLYGIFSNWCIMVLGSYFLGLKCGLGVVGFWLGIGTDETTRGIIMFFRWKSKRWMTKSLV